MWLLCQFQTVTSHWDVLGLGPCLLIPVQHSSVLQGMMWIWWQSIRKCSYSNPCDKDCSGTIDPTQASFSHPIVHSFSKAGQIRAIIRKGGRSRTEGNHHSIPITELWIMGKDLICCPGEHIITWLLKCWDNGTLAAWNLEVEKPSIWGHSLGKGASTSLEKGYKSSAFAGDFCQPWRKSNPS